VFRCLSLPVMLRAVLSKAASEPARQPVSQPVLKKPPTPPTTTAGPQRTHSTSSIVTTTSSTCPPLFVNTPPPLKLSVPSGDRGEHNPMLTSLLESESLTPSGGSSESLNSLRQKRVSLSDAISMKRQSSGGEVLNANAPSTRRVAPSFSANKTPPVSRSYSMPVAPGSPRQAVKLETISLLPFSDTKPLMSTPTDSSRSFSTPRSSSSELVNLLSSDDFAGPTSSTPDLGAKSQFDFNGSSELFPGVPVSTSGRTSAGMDWSNSSAADVVMDWETSSTSSDDTHQKSKNANMVRNSLPAGGIKTEPTVVHDGATAGLVAVQDKPPITVKITRHILKPSAQRRYTPDTDSTVDRATAKERAKPSQAPKVNSTISDMIPPESVDFEVDSLTSAVSSVASSSSGRSSASPRLPGGGTGPPEISKPGEKRPRVVGHKLLGAPAEKKRRSDEGRKMSRKIYEFDDDNDVFVSGGSQSGKISTIKITKSEGRLRIQKSGAGLGPSSHPVHKSVSSDSGQVSGSAVRLGRPPGFPLRPVVRTKSVMTPKSELKAVGLPVARMKPSPTAVSCGGIMPTSSSPIVAKPAVAYTTKSSTNTTAAIAKSKSLQPTAKRKGSLSAVIEKLSKSTSAGAEPDKKVLYDDIRLAIIREGNKPSTPTREMSSSLSSSLSKSSISSTKRPDTAKESSVRLTAPVRKPPISSGPQVTDFGRGQASMVRFTAPPASPPSAVNDQRPPHSVQSDILIVPKIPREQSFNRQLPGSLQSLHPTVAVSRMSEIEAGETGTRGPLTPTVMRMIRPPVSVSVVPPAKSSPVSGDTAARTKTPDVPYVGRGVDPASMQSVETPEEISERFHPARHFLDAMAHSSRMCDSNVVVERRLSPPRSPSPTPAAVQSGTLDLSKPTIIETSDSNRASNEIMSSVTGSVSSALDSNLPVDLSADSNSSSRQPSTSAAHFRTPSDVSLRSNSTCSPSAAGSPVASLIIDCFPGSPVLMTSNAVSSPIATSASDTAMSVPSDTDDSSRPEMPRRQSMSPVTSTGETSATDIDDDLMNEALIMSANVSQDQLGKL